MRDRQKGRMPQGSIIDKLIEEALLEFTSLTEDEAAPASEAAKRSHMSSVSGADPFVDPTDWANEIGNLGGPPSSARVHPPSAYQDGNLSALEDESLGSVRAADQVNKRGTVKVPTPAPSQARVTGGGAPASSRLGGGVPLLETVPGGTSSTGRSGAFYGAVVAALAAAAIGVAWMAHLIPH